ncbi:SMP-30/gluconolactonase/LRE family protein [Rhizobium straminoryzae]|uniref:SMP-30/gluconolactonase/LRE family protein n=1 Tax=Rhizobium straminoryzae TaxID=1387186 RepID=A0A549TBM3_9HYPH|nr:SMP-30/gluconolactonase/LRE family protein [Rhizobium straminoryzae]TRL39283.1 SMP-30/gluconolactonase/LRE family protein [Rhizobium straminoryzae]
MSEIHDFAGTILSDHASELGEGPTYDAATDTLWWFNILGKELHELNLASGARRVHPLPFKASVLARIDADRQLIATEQGLMIRDIASGGFTPYVELEPAHMGNRSNDGRVHASGALWIGTMGLKAQNGAGSIYHVAKGAVTRIVTGISIPNSICFSPDGATGYYTDTRIGNIMRLPLDAETGLPVGEATVFVPAGADGGPDGSVCDADGYLWNARWGAGAVDRYAPDGRHVARYSVPTSRASCPAFFGKSADRMAVTTAYEGASADERASDTKAGFLFDLGITVNGRVEPAYRL